MVKFVSFADSTAVAKADSIQPAGMLLLVDADLDIQTGSIINVDLDPQGNNKIQIESDGNLSFAMTPMNSGRLTGRLNIDKGFARYGMPPVLGEQTFRFVRGSYVAFSGDMMNPTLNIHATNTVKSNVTQEGQNSRLVNFDIGLSVTGTLERMDVAFDLSTRDDMTVANELESMSAEQRANQAINLMLYHTYTGGGTKGSGISNPLYSFLAGQLNNWAANTIKGVDISFGIDQYDRTVNGSTSQTTSYSYQVSKTLFNDRFKIVVGGNYSTDANADENFSQNLISDISFEYFLNSARSMYIRLFRHTGYESILEGEITQTGVGFVYRRKLSRLSDMFLPPRLVEKRHKRQQLDMDRQQAPAAKNLSSNETDTTQNCHVPAGTACPGSMLDHPENPRGRASVYRNQENRLGGRQHTLRPRSGIRNKKCCGRAPKQLLGVAEHALAFSRGAMGVQQLERFGRRTQGLALRQTGRGACAGERCAPAGTHPHD